MKIRQIRSKRLRAFLALGGILTIFGAGSILLKNTTGVFAQDGDFVNDVRTYLSSKDIENGAERTAYWSGERIHLDSRIEINGDTSSYNSPYVLYKFHKQYLTNSGVTPPDQFNQGVSLSSYDDGDYKVWRLNLPNLAGGNIVGPLLSAELNDLGTPAGYNFNIIQEFYSNGNVLLSRKSKTFETKKREKGFKNVSKGSWNGGYYDTVGTTSVVAAMYKNGSDSEIDGDSWPRLGIVKYHIHFETSEDQSQYGRNHLSRVIIKDKIPEYMEVTEDSLNDGWVFDSNSGYAIKELNVDSPFMSSAGADITLRFKKDTPDSVIGKEVVNSADVSIEYIDGSVYEKSADSKIIPRVLVKSGQKFGFSKSGQGGNFGSDIKEIDGVGAYNIDTIKELKYTLSLAVNNHGELEVPLHYIKDNIPNYLTISKAKIGPTSDFRFSESNPLEIYYERDNGSEEKISEISEDKEHSFESENDIRALVFKPKNGKIPGFLMGQAQYLIHIDLEFKASKEYLNDLVVLNDKAYQVPNSAEISIDDAKIYSTGVNNVGKWNLKLRNEIGLEDKPWYKYGSNYVAGDSLSTGFNTHYHIGLSWENVWNMDDVPGSKLIYLFPSGMDLSETAIANINSGDWLFVENYKNTGKSAVVQYKNFSSVDFLKVSRLIESGEYEVEKITIWDSSSQNYGDGPDDLDFHDDGDSVTKQVARSKAKFYVDSPLFVGTLKQISAKASGGAFTDSVKVKPGSDIEYKLSVVNFDSTVLNNTKSLEILPYAGDKSIVRGNDGSLGARGSNISVFMTGPVVDKDEKFNITYSTDAPGENEDDSYAKNFTTADRITDWSAVRMIKIEQKADKEISPQDVASITFPAKISGDAPDGSIAVNTFATGLSANSKFNEGNAAKLTVIHDAKVRGIAFEDVNGNGVFDQDVDTLLSGYKAKLMKGDQVIAEKITGDNGEYEILTDKFADGYKIQFEKPDGDTLNIVESQMNNGFENSNASNLENKETLDTFTFDLRENGEKEVVRNIGLFTPRGSVRVKFQTLDDVELKADQVPFENRPVGERYSTEFLRNQNRELADANGLRYQLSKRKEDSAQETGLIEPGEKTVVYQYEPMTGSIVTVKYVIQGTQTELAPQVVVKPQGTQVGTPFTVPYEQELTDANGLVYYRPTFPRGYGSRAGRVSINPIHLVVSYIPKTGGIVEYSYETETGEEILAPTELNLLSQQVGAKYSHTPDLEVEHKGITYVLKGLKDGSAPQNGTIKTEDQLITYVFVPKKGGQVVANYFDEEGNSISNISIVSATDTPVGTDYQNTPPAEITNSDGLKFTYKELGANSAPQNGKVKAETQEIRYIYAKKLGKGVISKFIDEDGNEISPDVEVVTDGAQVGTRYSAAHQNEITKDNLVFEFKEIAQNSAPENGKTTEDSQIVTFVYRKKLGGKVTAKFVDLDGNELKDPIEVVPEGQQVGTEYSSTKENEIEKDGLVYVFEVLAQNSAPESGRIKSDAQEVIYAYAPKKGGSVTAKFLDKNGVEIQIPEVIKPRGTQVGTPYESTSKDKIVINGKTYILREVKGEQTGKVSDGDIVIEYIFELEENPAAILAPNTGFMAGVGGLLAVIAVSIASFFTLKKKSRI